MNMNPYLLVNINQIYYPPVPSNYYPTLQLMAKLSHRLRVVCALEAAKMVLPVWDRYALKNKLPEEDKEFPQKVINLVEGWLVGKVTIDTILKTSYNATTINDVRANNAFSTIITTARTLSEKGSASHAADVIIYSASAYNKRLENLTKWWRRCYPLVKKELQDEYDTLCKEINGEL